MHLNFRRHRSEKHSLGIDIGRHSIKAVVMESTKRGPIATRILEARTPISAYSDGKINNARQLGDILRGMLASGGVRMSTAVTTIPTEDTFLRWIDMMRLDDTSLIAATPFEAEKYLPYSVDSSESAILQIDTTFDPLQNSVKSLLLAAPDKAVSARAEVLEYAGLEVTAVEPEPVALLRSIHSRHIRKGRFWKGQSLMYLHLGAESSGIITVQEMFVKFVRGLSWGGNRLSSALASALDIDTQAALAILKSEEARIDESGRLFWTDESGDHESGALEIELDRLRRELVRIMHYYRSLSAERSFEGNISQVVLSGGPASLDGLDQYIYSALQTRTAIGSPFSYEVTIPPGSCRTSFSVAAGLAMGDIWHRNNLLNSGIQSELTWERSAA